MASFTHVFTDGETTNWFKAFIALNITKEGLENFVDREIQNVHATVGRSCGICLTENLLKCPTHGICKNTTHCNFHNTQLKKPRRCTSSVCEQILKNITSQHRYSGPSWKNTKAEQWTSNHWEIAKCFCPPDGYANVTSVQETDFNGVLNICLNCKHFDSCFTFDIAPKHPLPPCVLTQARRIGRDVRHTPTCKIKDCDLREIFLTLTTLLTDAKCLSHDSSANIALTKLQQLQNDRLAITQGEMSELLKEAHVTLEKSQHVSVEAGKHISQESIKALVEIKAYLSSCLQTLAHHIQRGIEKIEDAEKDAISHIDLKLQNKKDEHFDKDFETILKKHYDETIGSVAVSPLVPSVDRKLRDVYVSPILVRIPHKCSKNDSHVCTYRDLFNTGDTLNRRIYIQGEPGVGKSTFAAHLTIDWSSRDNLILTCKHKRDFLDVKALLEFDYVFLITLRHSTDEREIVKMIKEQLIDVMYTECHREKAYTFLQFVLKHKKCLVVADGLDEWTDPNGKLALPLMASSHVLCTLLITTRPWKMTDERIKDSQIDSLLELKGISDSDALSKNVLKCLFADNMEVKFSEFKDYVSRYSLSKYLVSPMFLVLLVCIYNEDVFLKGSSCEIHCAILDSLMKKVSKSRGYFHPPLYKCFSETAYIQPNIQMLEVLSFTAFSLLFSCEKERSLVFSEKELLKYLSEDQMAFALKTGILSERKCYSLTRHTTSITFVHLSIQEFLAALHIANNPHVLENIIASYLAKFENAYIEISQIFIFLCGLNINAAYDLSYLMDMHNSNVYDIQSTIITGYQEAICCNINADSIRLYLDDFEVDMYGTDVNIVTKLLLTNKSNVRSLLISNQVEKTRSQLSDDSNQAEKMKSFLSCEQLHEIISLSAKCLRCLKIRGDFGVLDLSICCYIETLELKGNTTFEYNLLSNLSKLKSLTLVHKTNTTLLDDLQLPNSIEQIHLSGCMCSSISVHQLLLKLSTFDHQVTCFLDIFYVQSQNDLKQNTRLFSKCVDRVPNVNLTCFGISYGIYEAIRHAPLKGLTIKGIPFAELLFQTVDTLTNIEELNISAMHFCSNLRFPPSVRCLNFDPVTFSFESLCSLLHALSKSEYPVKFKAKVRAILPDSNDIKMKNKSEQTVDRETFHEPNRIIDGDQYNIFRMCEKLQSVTKHCLSPSLRSCESLLTTDLRFHMQMDCLQMILEQLNKKQIYNFSLEIPSVFSVKLSNAQCRTDSHPIGEMTASSPPDRSIAETSINLVCDQCYSMAVFESLTSIQTSVKDMTLFCVNEMPFISKTLPTFCNVEKLVIVAGTLSPFSLRYMLHNFARFTKPLECELIFQSHEHHLDEYLEIKQELILAENIDVLHFESDVENIYRAAGDLFIDYTNPFFHVMFGAPPRMYIKLRCKGERQFDIKRMYFVNGCFNDSAPLRRKKPKKQHNHIPLSKLILL